MNMELSGRGKPSPEKSHRVLARETTDHQPVGIGLNAAIVAVLDNEPVVLVVRKSPIVRAQLTSCRSDPLIRANTAPSKEG